MQMPWTCCCACRYGNDNLATLLEHYTDVDVVAAKLEWMSMRGLLLQATSCSSKVFYQTFIHPSLDTYPILGRMATIALTVPVTSVNCERGISTYNATKTDGRASLKVSSVEGLMNLNLNAPSVRDFPYDKAFQVWTLTKRHTGLTAMMKQEAAQAAQG